MKWKQQLVADVFNTVKTIEKFSIRAYAGVESPLSSELVVFKLSKSQYLKLKQLMRCNEVDYCARRSLICVPVLNGLMHREKGPCFLGAMQRKRAIQIELGIQTSGFNIFRWKK